MSVGSLNSTTETHLVPIDIRIRLAELKFFCCFLTLLILCPVGCLCQSYSYVNRKVWYHQISIPNNLGFIVSDLVSTPSFGSHPQPIPTRRADYAHHICYTDANKLCSFDIAFVPKLIQIRQLCSLRQDLFDNEGGPKLHQTS